MSDTVKRPPGRPRKNPEPPVAEPTEPTITWLGEGDDGPRYNEWNGVRFEIGTPVPTNNPYMLAKARGNPFFEVNEPAVAGPWTPAATKPDLMAGLQDGAGASRGGQLAGNNMAGLQSAGMQGAGAQNRFSDLDAQREGAGHTSRFADYPPQCADNDNDPLRPKPGDD